MISVVNINHQAVHRRRKKSNNDNLRDVET